MPRGKKKSHKGGHRCFTNELDLEREAERSRKDKEWRARQGIESDEESGEDEVGKASAKPKDAEVDDSSESEEESGDDEETQAKPKGISHLIEVENPNRIKQKAKKISELDAEIAKPALSRREKQEAEKQMAKDRYQKLHEAGKTDEARADLARLALIRKQRDAAAKKLEEEKKSAEDSKVAAEQRLLEKKQKSQH